MNASPNEKDGTKYMVKIYHLDGNLFFGSLKTLMKIMTPREDPEVVILHLNNAKTFDMSAAQGLADLTDRYKLLGKDLRLAGLSDIDAKKLARIHSVTKHLNIDDFDKSMGDRHFEWRREQQQEIKKKHRHLGPCAHLFSTRASYLNPEAADVGQASTLPQSWEAPHHAKSE